MADYTNSMSPADHAAASAAFDYAGVAQFLMQFVSSYGGDSAEERATQEKPEPSRPRPFQFPEPGPLDVTIREGLLIGDGQAKSTGRVPFTTISGWTDSHRALLPDGAEAKTPVVAGYSSKLVASGAALSIPDGSLILGIKIYVKRRRL